MQAQKRSNMSKQKNTKSGIAPRSTKTSKKGSPTNNRGGQGTFSEQAPVAIGNRTFTQKARFISNGDRMTVIHSEYIGDITGDTGPFVVSKTLALNPGIDSSFPWLNQIASRFESYRFKKLNYRFNTERPTTESGFLAIVPDYDATDPAPGDKVTAFQYEGVGKSSPWQNLLQVNTPANLNRRKSYFTRLAALNANENLGLYDSGNIFICVGGNSGAVSLGQLWCDYVVEFMTPQLDTSFGAGGSGVMTGQTAQTAALPFGTAATSTFSRSPLWTYDGVTGAITFLRAYQGLFYVLMTGTTLTAITPGGTGTFTSVGAFPNAGSTQCFSAFRANVLIGQTLDLSATAATIASAQLRVGEYLNSLG